MKFRKAISTALAACILAGSCITPTVYAAEPASEMRCGDVDLSGIVDVSDAVLICRYHAEDEEAVIEAQGKINADVTHDSNITGDDTVLILRYIAKLVSYSDLEP